MSTFFGIIVQRNTNRNGQRTQLKLVFTFTNKLESHRFGFVWVNSNRSPELDP